jgi:cytochrome c-type biogenesis protein
MGPNNVTIGIAFLAGLASFLSPCVLALVPAYIGYLGGRSLTPKGEVTGNRMVAFTHGLAFVIGFSFVFVTLGAAASLIGGIQYDLRIWLTRIGGIAVIIFGLHTMGVLNIPFLNYDKRLQIHPDPRLSYLSSFFMGIFFSAGWTPCIGPVLGSILTLALRGADLELGVILLSAYSLGLALPFLLAALGIGRAAELLQQHAKAIRWISIATGAVLVILGVMLFTGTLERLAQFGFFIDFGS